MSDDVKRVKIAVALLGELDRKWSRPVEVMVSGEDEDGDLELTFRWPSADILRKALDYTAPSDLQAVEGDADERVRLDQLVDDTLQAVARGDNPEVLGNYLKWNIGAALNETASDPVPDGEEEARCQSCLSTDPAVCSNGQYDHPHGDTGTFRTHGGESCCQDSFHQNRPAPTDPIGEGTRCETMDCRIGIHRWIFNRPYRGLGPWTHRVACSRCGKEEPRP